MIEYKSVEIEYLFEVLRCAVKNQKAPEVPENIDWKEFLKEAKKQQVFSMIVAVLDYSALPDEIATELYNHFNSELVRLIAMQNEFSVIKEKLNENCIKFMPLKGEVIKEYYPKQRMRQMSDIDILYDESKCDKLLEIMTKEGYKLTSVDGNSDDFVKEPFYTFEMHRNLFKDVYGFCPDFSFVWKNAKKVSEYEYAMSVEDLYLHSVAHMYKHFIFGGFGVKFLFDTYLIVSKNFHRWNQNYIDSKIEEMNFADFEKKIRKLSFDFVDGNKLSNEQIDFINKNISAGIFGNNERKINVIYENYKIEHKTNSKFRYLLYRIFPDKNKMASDYPQLNKKPYLLWLFYLKRIIKKSKVGIKKVADELKEIKKENRQR